MTKRKKLFTGKDSDLFVPKDGKVIDCKTPQEQTVGKNKTSTCRPVSEREANAQEFAEADVIFPLDYVPGWDASLNLVETARLVQARAGYAKCQGIVVSEEIVVRAYGDLINGNVKLPFSNRVLNFVSIVIDEELLHQRQQSSIAESLKACGFNLACRGTSEYEKRCAIFFKKFDGDKFHQARFVLALFEEAVVSRLFSDVARSGEDFAFKRHLEVHYRDEIRHGGGAAALAVPTLEFLKNYEPDFYHTLGTEIPSVLATYCRTSFDELLYIYDGILTPDEIECQYAKHFSEAQQIAGQNEAARPLLASLNRKGVLDNHWKTSLKKAGFDVS